MISLEPLRIMSAADATYFPYVPTALNAGIRNTKGLVEIGVVAQGIREVSKAECRRKSPDQNIEFYDIKLTELNGLMIKTALSPMALARALMSDIVSWDKFLYLDVNAVSGADIHPLYENDIETALIAARFDDGNLNSGVMLINASEWRKRKLGQQILEYARLHRPREADQASIEAICGAEGFHLDSRWNVLIDPVWGYVPLRMRSNFDDACIVHYLTGFKPWNLGRLLIPKGMLSHWDRYALTTSIPRPFRSEAKLLARQAKTLAVETVRRLLPHQSSS